jgi:hypothetical protein
LADVNPFDGFCEAGKAADRESITTKGSMVVTSTNPLEVSGPFFLRVSQQPPRFPFIFLAGSFVVDHSVLATIAGEISTGDINIKAGGDVLNNLGIFSLVAPFDNILLQAVTRVVLKGPNLGPALTNPSSLLLGEYVKLTAEKGNVEVANASLTSYQGGIDFFAPRGNVEIGPNVVIFSIQDRVNTIGFCRYQVLTKNGVQLGSVVGLNDPTNIFVCFPQIIKK